MRSRGALHAASAILFLWDLVKLALFMVGLVFVALRVAGMFDIGNFYFYYGPAKVIITEEHTQ